MHVIVQGGEAPWCFTNPHHERASSSNWSSTPPTRSRRRASPRFLWACQPRRLLAAHCHATRCTVANSYEQGPGVRAQTGQSWSVSCWRCKWRFLTGRTEPSQLRKKTNPWRKTETCHEGNRTTRTMIFWNLCVAQATEVPGT